ncbi:Response regulator receiver domain-containing protein [Rhodoblastus acidophilus]|uniref:Response regulator receiver domain-containing protein n=2 Tax=Rhodoblastus acidophilus TaxID=1074 RepID=A0A212QJN2_RHOAC|nr:Response regulator receiver domain-containing protein [Rhodoblastus acidophilus]
MAAPGEAIQTHGWLIACDDQARVVRRHSANLGDIFPQAGPLLGARLRELLGSEESHRLRNLLSRFSAPARPALVSGCRFPGVEGAFDAAVHFNGEDMVLELEMSDAHSGLAALDRAAALIDRLDDLAGPDEIGKRAAMLVGAALDAEHTFFLLLEADNARLAGAYRRLGAPPPAPESLQAFWPGRRLFAVGDVDAPEIPLRSEPDMLPLDAGMTALRAPGEPLRQWLREAGFRSAAFLPVASDGLRLALIVGLGRQPRFPGLGLRGALELFAEALALRLRLVLPAHHQPWAPDAPADPLSVLIVEDQHMVATQLAAALDEAGARVVRICGTVSAALDALDETFDAALLDYTLGGENVIPVAEQLEARGKPFVFASGHGDDLDLPLAFAGKPIVGKPYKIDKIVAALRAAKGK